MIQVRRKFGIKLTRAFSSNTQNDMNDQILSIFDNFLKSVEIMREEYLTADKPPTKEEVQQEVLRSAHLGRYALDQTLDKMNIFTNTFNESQDKFDILCGIQSKNKKRFEKMLPENKTRPSLLLPF